jgi:hypothetical protein
MSVTSISSKNKFLLWAITAGRCQYRGCNKLLYQDILTKANYNQSYIAHIVADVEGGPRGDKARSPLLKDDINNLMLLCDSHHRRIDVADVVGHPESLLLGMKKEHEQRILIATGITPNMMSHMLTYRANVGVHTPELSYQTLSPYLAPTHYPAIADTIDLGLTNSLQRDRDTAFWTTEIDNLEAQFNKKLLQNFTKGEIQHLSIFAFAPIPLLIKLGTMVNDIYPAEIYQPVRTPKTWKLDDDLTEVTYHVIHPKEKHSIVALNISLSATINNDRITDGLGQDVSIYTITIDSPFNDYLKSKRHLQDFSTAIRKLFNEIKANYSADTPIHIFPAMPIAKAVELGRVWMPKADMPLYVYDQNTANGGFSKAIEIINH